MRKEWSDILSSKIIGGLIDFVLFLPEFLVFIILVKNNFHPGDIALC